jgi:hypothetical protein
MPNIDLRRITQENQRLLSLQREQERKLKKLEHFKRSIVNTLSEEDKVSPVFCWNVEI